MDWESMLNICEVDFPDEIGSSEQKSSPTENKRPKIVPMMSSELSEMIDQTKLNPGLALTKGNSHNGNTSVHGNICGMTKQ